MCAADASAVEHVLAAVGTQVVGAVMVASLPSAGYQHVALLDALINLRDLDLSGNALQEFGGLASLPSLRRLDLAGNCLALLAPSLQPAGACFTALEQLDLSYNRLEPAALQLLAGLPRLRELDVSGNALQAVPALHPTTAFPALRKLAAGQNQLTGAALVALAQLPLLQQLLLPGNCISSVPALAPAAHASTATHKGGTSGAAFAKLQVLDLTHNRIADVAVVQQLHGLPSIERLLLAGNPVARAGFGATGTLAGTLHRTHAGTGGGTSGLQPGSGSSRAAGGGGGGRPSMARSFQFTAVEEASAVSMRAKALARRTSTSNITGSTAASVAGASRPPSSASVGLPAEVQSGEAAVTHALAAPPPGVNYSQEQSDASSPAAAASAENPVSAGGSTDCLPSVTTAVLAGTPASQSAAAQPATSFIDWESADEGEEGLEGEGQQIPAGWRWSNQSAAGSVSGSTSASLAGDVGSQADGQPEDPTVRLALALGLDPLQLPMFGGPGISGSPTAAIKALRHALAHPAVAPRIAVARACGSSCLKMTKSVLAKQRQKAGAAGSGEGSLEGRVEQVQAIDALLAAMKRRLKAVQEAMAQDLAKQLQQQQQGEQGAPEGQQRGTGAGSPAGACGGFAACGNGDEHSMHHQRQERQQEADSREQRASALFNMHLFADALGLQHDV